MGSIPVGDSEDLFPIRFYKTISKFVTKYLINFGRTEPGWKLLLKFTVLV